MFFLLKFVAACFGYLTIILCTSTSSILLTFANVLPYCVFFTILLDRGRGERLLNDPDFRINFEPNRSKFLILSLLIFFIFFSVILNQFFNVENRYIMIAILAVLFHFVQGEVDVLLKFFARTQRSPIVILFYQVIVSTFVFVSTILLWVSNSISLFSIAYLGAQFIGVVGVFFIAGRFFELPKSENHFPPQTQKIQLKDIFSRFLLIFAKFLPVYPYFFSSLLGVSPLINRTYLFVFGILYLTMISKGEIKLGRIDSILALFAISISCSWQYYMFNINMVELVLQNLTSVFTYMFGILLYKFIVNPRR